MTTDYELLKELVINVFGIIALMIAISLGCCGLIFLAATEEPYRPEPDLGTVKYYNTNTTTASTSSSTYHQQTAYESSNCYYFDKNVKQEEPKEKPPVLRPYMIPTYTWAICPKERVHRQVWDLFAWGSSEMTQELYYLETHGLRDEANIWELDDCEIGRRWDMARCVAKRYAHVVDDPLVLAHYVERFHRFGKVRDTKPRAKFYKNLVMEELMMKYTPIPSVDEITAVDASTSDNHHNHNVSSPEEETSEINAPVVDSNAAGNLGVDTTGSPTWSSNHHPSDGAPPRGASLEELRTVESANDHEDDEDHETFAQTLQSLLDLIGSDDDDEDEDDDDKSVPAASPPSFEGPFTVDSDDSDVEY